MALPEVPTRTDEIRFHGPPDPLGVCGMELLGWAVPAGMDVLGFCLPPDGRSVPRCFRGGSFGQSRGAMAFLRLADDGDVRFHWPPDLVEGAYGLGCVASFEVAGTEVREFREFRGPPDNWRCRH